LAGLISNLPGLISE